MKRFLLILLYSLGLRNFLKIIIGVKFSYSNFLKKEPQFILVANHNSHLDAMSIMASLPSAILHKVKPVAAQDYFGKTAFQTWCSNFFINTLLIQRKRDTEHPENDPIFKMNQVLKEGNSLLIFPEGTRGEPNQPKEFKAGVALILIKNPHIPYIPIYLKSMGKALPKGDNLIVPYESAEIYGKPKYIENQSIENILTTMKEDIESLAI